MNSVVSSMIFLVLVSSFSTYDFRDFPYSREKWKIINTQHQGSEDIHVSAKFFWFKEEYLVALKKILFTLERFWSRNQVWKGNIL